MVRKKQVNSENGAVLNRDFPRRGRSLIIGAEELRRLFPNVKPEYIDLAIKRFSNYRFGDDENEIEAFGKILIAVIIQDALGTKEDGFYEFFLLELGTGMRRGEMLAKSRLAQVSHGNERYPWKAPSPCKL